MIHIHGKAEHVSREQLRAYFHASLVVLGYHGMTPKIQPFTVRIKSYVDGHAGQYSHDDGQIELLASLDGEAMLTVVIHETIHACRDFGEGTDEKCVSTLTARLKATVGQIAQILLDGTYQRAAFVAHTKISYKAKDGDFYDRNQYRKVGVRGKYQRKRKAVLA